jgi:mono/diheme cytochrome c family protein
MRCALLLTLLLAACGSARRGVPVAGPTPLSPSAQEGRVLFMKYCHQCHPGGEASTGPALNNKEIPRAVMTLQVREGVLGTMPAFSEAEISDGDLDKILDYVETLRSPGAS